MHMCYMYVCMCVGTCVYGCSYMWLCVCLRMILGTILALP